MGVAKQPPLSPEKALAPPLSSKRLGVFFPRFSLVFAISTWIAYVILKKTRSQKTENPQKWDEVKIKIPQKAALGSTPKTQYL